MTVVKCPHNCGGFVNTATDDCCTSCRRAMSETEFIWGEDVVKIETAQGMQYPNASPVGRKLSWCWQWWGPANHRMRCRLPTGHDGEHDTHEVKSGHAIVAANGEVIRHEK